jgi:polysaccharide pyruvyl transferase CsaB
MRILLSGYYGFGNLGDEAILAGTVAALRRRLPTAEITALSARPEATGALYAVRAVRRWHGPTLWHELGRTDLLVQGGGGLIQDSTSARSPLYYLGLLVGAHLRRKPFVIFAQGLGPLRGRIARAATRSLFARAAAVTVRDAASAQLLGEMGLRREVTVCGDAALLLQPARADSVAAYLPPHDSRPVVGLALRQAPGAEGLIEGGIAAAHRLQEAADARIVVMAFNERDDAPLAARAAQELGAVQVPQGGPSASRPSPAEWMALTGQLDLVIAMRLHAAIFAAAMARPFVGLSYDPKVAAFAQSAGAVSVGKGTPPAEVGRAVEGAWHTREADRDRRVAAAERLRAEATRGIEIVAEVALRA